MNFRYILDSKWGWDVIMKKMNKNPWSRGTDSLVGKITNQYSKHATC